MLKIHRFVHVLSCYSKTFFDLFFQFLKILKIECVMEELCILVIIVLEFRAGH